MALTLISSLENTNGRPTLQHRVPIHRQFMNLQACPNTSVRLQCYEFTHTFSFTLSINKAPDYLCESNSYDFPAYEIIYDLFNRTISLHDALTELFLKYCSV